MRCILILLILVGNSAFAQSTDCTGRIVQYGHESFSPPSSWHLVIERSNGAALHYFGAVHSDDPGHPQFAGLDAAYEHARPTVVYYEGPERPVAGTADETIRLFGESGYVRFLAQRDSIRVARLEPDPRAEMAFVLQRFPIDQAMLFYVLREAARLRDRKEASPDEVSVQTQGLLNRAAALIDSPIKTIGDLEAAYRSYWTHPLDWRDAPAAWFDPGAYAEDTGGMFTHSINRASSHFRNLHMVDVLANDVLQGERAFAVVGRNHVPLQAPALTCLLDHLAD